VDLPPIIDGQLLGAYCISKRSGYFCYFYINQILELSGVITMNMIEKRVFVFFKQLHIR